MKPLLFYQHTILFLLVLVLAVHVAFHSLP